MRKKRNRNLRVHSIQFLENTWSVCKLNIPFEKAYVNMYYSLATFDGGIPFQDLRVFLHDNKTWNAEANKKIISYDCLIDIDAGNHSEIQGAYESAKNIKNYFDFYGVPYQLRFSGCGFHFVIPYKYLPQHLSFLPLEKPNVYNFCYLLAKFIKDNLSEMVDETIFDSRRLIKIPFSLALYEDNSFVCFPYDKDTIKLFKHFKLEDYHVLNFRRNIFNLDAQYTFNEGNDLISFIAYMKLKNKVISEELEGVYNV